MAEDETFASLAAAIEPELKPTRRLRPPWQRALVLLPYALFMLALFTIVLGLRSDAAALGPWFLWGLGAIELATAYRIFHYVLRESVPGSSARPSAWLVVAGVVFSLQIGISQLTFLRSPVTVDPDRALTLGATCLGRMMILGVPALVLGLVLASRGLPLRPRLSGILGGILGGLVAEAVYRSHCPFTHVDHVIPWHSGAVVLLGLLGFFAGAVWELENVRRWRRRRGR